MEVNSQTEGLPNDRIHVCECLIIVVGHHIAGSLFHCPDFLANAVLNIRMLREEIEDPR